MNRKAPRAFLICLAGALVWCATVWLGSRMTEAHVVACCMLTGAIFAVFGECWPRRVKRQPKQRSVQDKATQTAGAIIGYQVAHHIIRKTMRGGQRGPDGFKR